MAKVRRLFETDANNMPPTNPSRKPNLDATVSDILGKQFEPDIEDVDVSLPTPTFEELLPELDLPPEVETLLDRFFVMDHKRRPTSEKLLQSKEYVALEMAAQSIKAPTEQAK